MSRYEPCAYKRLTDNERAEAVALWEAGSSTIEDLAGRFDCSPRALLYLFKRQGVTKGSKAATFAAEIRAETFADAGKIQHLIMSQNLFGKSWVSIPADEEAVHGDVDHGGRDVDTTLGITDEPAPQDHSAESSFDDAAARQADEASKFKSILQCIAPPTATALAAAIFEAMRGGMFDE